MADSLQYITAEPTRAILGQLYADDENPVFVCHIHVPERHLDFVEDTIKTIYIERLRDDPHSYKMANEDRIYRTRARVTPQGEPFEIDVVAHGREFSTRGATILVSPEVYRIIEDYVLDRLGNE
jgi:hypothetical protein